MASKPTFGIELCYFPKQRFAGQCRSKFLSLTRKIILSVAAGFLINHCSQVTKDHPPLGSGFFQNTVNHTVGILQIAGDIVIVGDGIQAGKLILAVRHITLSSVSSGETQPLNIRSVLK